MRSPPEIVESDHAAIDRADRRNAVQRRMNPAMIVVITEVPQLPFEISGTPEGNVIQQLSTYGSDQPLDERVRYRHMRYGLDLAHVKNGQTGLPAMKLEQRIVVAIEMPRQAAPSTVPVCTNKPIGLSETILAQLDLAKYFSAVLGGDSRPFRRKRRWSVSPLVAVRWHDTLGVMAPVA
jgi:phosphoglycolate phosphatase-like HAD superfamily hydrolase